MLSFQIPPVDGDDSRIIPRNSLITGSSASMLGQSLFPLFAKENHLLTLFHTRSHTQY